MAYYSNYKKLKTADFLGQTVKVGDSILITKDLKGDEYRAWSFKIPKGQTITVDAIYEVPFDKYLGEELLIVFDISNLDKDVLRNVKKYLDDDMFNEINDNKLDLHKYNDEWAKHNLADYDKGNLWLGEIEGDFKIVSEKRFVKDFTISVESFEKLTKEDHIKIQKYITDVVLPHIVDTCSDNVDLAELTITDQNYKYNPR